MSETLTPDEAARLAKLIERSGRSSADARRAVKELRMEMDTRLDAIEARLAAAESGKIVYVLGAVKGLSTPAQVALTGAVLVLALALAGVIFPGIAQAISAIGGVNAPISAP